MKEQIVIG